MKHTGTIADAILLVIPVLLGMLLGTSCSDPAKEEFVLDIPEGYPELPIPEDNELSLQRVELGRKLFFDPFLSVDSSVSCASCHKPSLAFADTLERSFGVHGNAAPRNSPSLMNTAWHPYFNYDGGRRTLEDQIIAPLQGAAEMGTNLRDVVERLQANGRYTDEMLEAYGRDDHYAVMHALAAFQRTLVTGWSAYDRGELSESGRRGQSLFEEHCQSCHAGFDFSAHEFLSNGLYSEYPDQGRGGVTFLAADSGKFKVPSLRNVALTYPYMHDGSIATLAEVIAHYNRGGAEHRNQDPRVRPLGLSEDEMADLEAFLRGLTDRRFE